MKKQIFTKKTKLLSGILLSGFAMILLLSSCNTSKTNNPIPAKQKTTKDLTIPKTFNWNTAKQTTITLQAVDNQNKAIKGAKFSVFSADPETENGKLIASGATNDNGVYSISHEIPAYYSSLFIRSDYVGVPSPGKVYITNNNIDLTLGGTSKSTKFKSSFKAQSSNPIYKFMGNYNSQGVPDYLEPTNDIITRSFLNDINNTLPERRKLPISHPQYFGNNVDPNLHLVGTSDVWVTFVSEGAGYKNVLGFYTYPTNNPPQSTSDIDSINIIFPNVSFQGSGGGLHAGNKVFLGQFPKNTSIGFVLIADGWKNQQVTNGKWILYSQNNLNPESDPNLKQHAVLLSDNARDLFLLGFEDIRRDKRSCDQDFNDAVFYLTVNPIQNIDQSSLPLVDYTGSDSDNDGVPDNFDDYPNDPTMAFNNYYFQQGHYGTLAFEDLWPSTGDYDFNDAVIDYNFNQITNGNNEVVKIKGTFILRAQGAYYHNGFGIELPINKSLVSSVTGNMNVPGNIVNLDNKNLESGQTKAVIILWEDGYDVLPGPGTGLGVNTDPSAPYVTPTEMHIEIDLNQPVSLSDLGNPPYNPFIFINKDRTHEIHLPNKPPTELADTRLFGTGDDDSQPGSSRYYKTASNLPWAINIIEKFDYPKEKVDITQTYTHFATWAESGGIEYPDWYKDLPGYRVTTNVYLIP